MATQGAGEWLGVGMSLGEPTLTLGKRKALPKLQGHPATCPGTTKHLFITYPSPCDLTSQGFGSLGIVVLLGQQHGSKAEEQIQLRAVLSCPVPTEVPGEQALIPDCRSREAL